MLKVMVLIVLCYPAIPVFSATGTVPPDPVTGRWYTVAEQEQGRALYAAHCAGCHGARAEGQPGWEKRNESGYYPAPPLDGTGHSAHHPIGQVLRTLDAGGGSMGGWMPSFVDVLSDGDKRAVFAWIQSLWPADIYQAWLGVHDDMIEEK